MAIPSNAPVFVQVLSPSDTLDFYVSVSQGEDGKNILMVDEDIESYQLSLSAEAVAAGLRLMTGNRQPVREGRVISFWLSVDPLARDLPIFKLPGVLLGIELTIETTSDPSRTKRRTFGIRVAGQ